MVNTERFNPERCGHSVGRNVGLKVGTLAGDTYSVGGSRVNSIKTAQKIRFEAVVESAAVVQVTQQPANVK